VDEEVPNGLHDYEGNYGVGQGRAVDVCFREGVDDVTEPVKDAEYDAVPDYEFPEEGHFL